MKKLVLLFVAALLLSGIFAPLAAQAATDTNNACWGQATAVFAATGEMGKHASQESTPRLGLKNLARALFEAGVLEDDSLQALGAFVADALGLSIDACLD